MKRTLTVLAVCLTVAVYGEDSILISGPKLEIHARSAENLTGGQSNAIVVATSHIDNATVHLSEVQAQRIAEALTNAAAFATAAQGIKADGALQPPATSGLLRVESDLLAREELASFSRTNSVVRLYADGDTNRFIVYQVGGIVNEWETTNAVYYVMSFSQDFGGGWLTNPYPAEWILPFDNGWTLTFDENEGGEGPAWILRDPEELLAWVNRSVSLVGEYYGFGVATIVPRYNPTQYAIPLSGQVVNITSRLDSAEQQIASLNGDVAGLFVSNATTRADVGFSSNRIDAVQSSFSRFLSATNITIYGDILTTNEVGYAAFVNENPASLKPTILVANNAIGTNSVSFKFPLTNGYVDVAALTYGYGPVGALGYSMLTIFNSNGVAVASNSFTVAGFTGAATRCFTNSVSTDGTWISDGWATLTFTMAKTSVLPQACQIYTGGAYPMTAVVTTTPLPYLTQVKAAGLIEKSSRESAFYTDISYLPMVGEGATNVVMISEGKRVYFITATNTVNVLTNVATGIALNGRAAEWELWVNFTNPAGTNMTWCPCMRFDFTPEITCTGVWKFACSTTDGVNVRARQTWPSDYSMDRQNHPYVVTSGSSALAYNAQTVIAAANTNGSVYFRAPDSERLYKAKLVFSSTASASSTNTLFGYAGAFVIGLAEYTSTNLVFSAVSQSAAATRWQTRWFVIPTAQEIAPSPLFEAYGYRSAIHVRRFNATAGDVQILDIDLIPLNQNEAAAYNAGWRP